ncbi:DNA repair protein RecO [Pelagovum sp. HNIBRBA483]|uniref:DNA repair protein RecO n=1 Tax=Pelagovum sp. HNIBRBA483 TaxID=3233341 RepID=UPI0034A17981
MEWRDQGILLSARPHGESAAIVEVLTEQKGRHAGVVRGGASRKLAPVLQTGAQLDLTWKARLEDHLGSFSVELIKSRSAAAMGDRLSLAGVAAVASLLVSVLPERESHTALYWRTVGLFDMLGDTALWPLAYLRWEMALLEELGFGLDLSACAATGINEELTYISPKSGRAVSAQGAGDWAARLLPLPPVMKGEGDGSPDEIVQALGTTGYFLEHKLFAALGKKSLPEARHRVIAAIGRLA